MKTKECCKYKGTGIRKQIPKLTRKKNTNNSPPKLNRLTDCTSSTGPKHPLLKAELMGQHEPAQPLAARWHFPTGLPTFFHWLVRKNARNMQSIQLKPLLLCAKSARPQICRRVLKQLRYFCFVMSSAGLGKLVVVCRSVCSTVGSFSPFHVRAENNCSLGHELVLWSPVF